MVTAYITLANIKMTKKILSILLCLNLLSSFGQIDTIEMTNMQFKKFQSIMSELDNIILSQDQVYEKDTRFDSLLKVAENFNHKNEIEKSQKVYNEAKKIYPNSCLITLEENPLIGKCIYSEYGLSKLKDRLESTTELMSTLRVDNDLKLSPRDKSLVYSREVDNYLLYLTYLPKFYNANLESRIWIAKYFGELQAVKITDI